MEDCSSVFYIVLNIVALCAAVTASVLIWRDRRGNEERERQIVTEALHFLQNYQDVLDRADEASRFSQNYQDAHERSKI